MIELRLNPATGKHEIPGEPKFGRVYKIVDLMTGVVGYNCTTSDLPGLDPASVKMIEGYDSFRGWMTDIISKVETYAEVKRLNALPKEVIETFHTNLVARVKTRLAEKNDQPIDGFSILADMKMMHEDIMGRRERPALPGWSK